MIFKSFYLTNNAFAFLAVCVAIFTFGLLEPWLYLLGKIAFFSIWGIVLFETIILFQKNEILNLNRKLPEKLSNGDQNTIKLKLENLSSSHFFARVVEDLPELLQVRIWERKLYLPANKSTILEYKITPIVRGEYTWKGSNVFVRLRKFSLVERRINFEIEDSVPCYPSFLQFNKLQIDALTNQQSQNEKLVRKIGQSLEFEQIKDYTPEDDYRHINWKASAKKGQLMVNQYQDERSQDIYSIIDLGRIMKMPFYGQTLLDYAINGSLALSKTIISMSDRAGLLGFSFKKSEFLPSKKDMKQFGKINETLYQLETDFSESDFEYLYQFVRKNIKHRSLLVIFTNFDSTVAMHRQLPYLKALSRFHLLLVVFFENSEISQIVDLQANDLKDIYTKTIGKSMLLQNKMMVRELSKHGIQSLLTQPENLSAEVINKYLAIKKKNMI